MKVWLVWETYGGKREVIGVAKTREAVDKICREHYKKYRTDVGEIDWEEWEVVE